MSNRLSVTGTPPLSTTELVSEGCPEAGSGSGPIDAQPAEQLTAERLILPQPASRRPSGAFQVFLSTFVTILFAELGDKTQLTTLLMSAESHSPWIVFLGAGSALIATSLFGVLLGRWLSTRVSPRTIETAAGATLLLIAVLLLWDITHL